MLSRVGPCILANCAFPNSGGAFRIVSNNERLGVESPNGAFYGQETRSIKTFLSDEEAMEKPTEVWMDLSRSNVIFGNSDTVQPSSLRALALIRAY